MARPLVSVRRPEPPPHARAELGLVRGGIRVDWLTRWDLLADASARVAVRPPLPGEDDRGYGLFTRGSTTLHASAGPTLRLGGVLWSLGLRAGVPVPVGPFRSAFAWKDEVNSEVVATLLGDKLRFAVGCNPLQDTPAHHCWRDLYYSFGVNDLAGLAYWTGANPFVLDRLFLPFLAVRGTSDTPSAEIGLVRGGWQPWRGLGLWGDISGVFGPDSTRDASLAYEVDIRRWIRRIGLRGGFPLSVRQDARIKDANLELVFTLAHGIRLAAGAFPFRIDKDDVRWFDASYVSIGFDPGSFLLVALRGD